MQCLTCNHYYSMKLSSLNSSARFTIAGLLFAMLWASASAAGKFGIQSVEPLLLFTIRFLSAGMLMLVYAHLFQKKELPQRTQWMPLVVFGLLNTTLCLGFYITALQQVSAGIGGLAPSVNPLFITVLSGVWMGSKVKPVQWISIALGLAGILLATYPLLQNSTATLQGISLMLLSMLCYSVGTIYYAKTRWQLSALVINGWQVLIGGLLLLPFCFLLHKTDFKNHFDTRFWKAEAWLVIPVSVVAVQLWLYLLKINAAKASLWLFLCPIFGFVYAAVLLHEDITSYTVAGTALVIAGLYLGQRNK